MSRREEAQNMFVASHESNGDQENHEQTEENSNVMEMVEMFMGMVKILKAELKTIGFEEEESQVRLIQTFFESREF